MSKPTPMVSIPSPLSKGTRFNFENDVIATTDFFEFCPNYYLHLVKGQSVKVKPSAFARTLPLPVPTFGKCNIIYRHFFVPYNLVDKAYYDIIADTRHNYADNTTGYPTKVRSFKEGALASAFINPQASSIFGPMNLLVTEVNSGQPYDFSFYQTGQNDRYFVFTALGRKAYKLLWSLGYRISWNGGNKDFEWSALPLLAIARIYLDYYFPQQFVDTGLYYSLAEILERDMSTQRDLSQMDLQILLMCTYWIAYDRDYFTSQFTKPYLPESTASSVNIPDVIGNGNTNGSVRTGSIAPNTSIPVNNNVYFTEYLIETLNKLTAYYKRNQLAGGYAYNRMLSRFGMRIDANVVSYIGEQIIPLNIGDVMSTANTVSGSTGSPIGSYSGKALGFKPNDNSEFNFTANEPGIYISMVTVKPYISYYQGFDRHNRHLSKFDFLTPEFDGLGMQATAAGELYYFFNSALNNDGNNNVYEKVYGLVPRYAEYKFGHDAIIGDFNLNTINTGTDAYHLFRQFKDTSFTDVDDIVFGLEFCLTLDRSQYDRIFGLYMQQADPIRLYTHYSVESYAPMRSLYDDQVFDQLEHDSQGFGKFATGGARFE